MNTIKSAYYIHYDISLPFNVYVNGIKVDGGEGTASVSDYVTINPFLKTGKNTITLNVFTKGNEKLPPEIMKQIGITLYKSKLPKNDNITLINKFIFSEELEPLPFKIETWEFTAESVFPELNKKIDNSINVSNLDKKELLQEVLGFYNELKQIINRGDSTKYLDLFDDSNLRKMNSMYYNDTQRKEYLQKIKERISLSKGFMKPIENFKLRIHPNNKIISLESLELGTPLYSEDDLGNIKTYGLMLYKNKDGELKIY